jgi:hypothetical protein
MTRKSDEKLVAEKIEWLRKRCTVMVQARTFAAAETGKSIDAETEAFRETAKALLTVERYMLPEANE